MRISSIYSNLKIKYKLFILHFVLVLTVCVCSLSAFQTVLKIYDDLLYNEAAQVLNLSTSNIESELKRIVKLSYNMVSDSKLQYYVDVIKNSPSVYEKNEKIRLLIDLLMAHAASEKNIASIHYVDTEGNLYSNGADPIEIRSDFKDYIVRKSVENEGEYVFINSLEGDSSLIIARTVRAVPGLSLANMGTLFIRYNINHLVEQHLSSSPKNQSSLLIISDKKTIYASRELGKIRPADYQFDNSSGYQVKVLNNEKLFIAHNISDYTKWLYISIIPYDRVFEKIIFMKSMIILIFLTIFLLTMLVSIKFAWNLTKPLERLTEKMKQVENGNFQVEELEASTYERQDEIGCLHKDFQIMTQKIDALIKEDFIKQLLIKDSQLKALQAQINPHFLYNTLDSINWLAKLNKQYSISQMVESLGSLLRSTITSKEVVITLDEELKLLESYITIQKIRYEERLHFELLVPDQLRIYKIPKLTLQPIVENAINYGLENMLGVCRITVKSDCLPEGLRLMIQDNGPGIEAQLLEKLQNGEVKAKGFGIGLKNIDDRIKIIFGESYGISIDSQPAQGTCVMIHIPYETGEENVQSNSCG